MNIARLLISFCTFFLSMNVYSNFNYPHNGKAIIIFNDKIENDKLALKSGDTVTLTGTICVAKVHPSIDKLTCRNTRGHYT